MTRFNPHSGGYLASVHRLSPSALQPPFNEARIPRFEAFPVWYFDGRFFYCIRTASLSEHL